MSSYENGKGVDFLVSFHKSHHKNELHYADWFRIVFHWMERAEKFSDNFGVFALQLAEQTWESRKLVNGHGKITCPQERDHESQCELICVYFSKEYQTNGLETIFKNDDFMKFMEFEYKMMWI